MDLATLQLILKILLDLALGAITGAETALLGYMKGEDLEAGFRAIFTKKFWENFSPPKALKTVLLGAVIGAFTAGKTYLPTDNIEVLAFTNFLNIALILGVENFVKFVMRRTPLMKGWDWFKQKFLQLIEAVYR